MAIHLNFCTTCSEKRVRDVKTELELLFQKEQVNLLSCGICCCEIPLKTELDGTNVVSASASDTKPDENDDMKTEPELVEQASDVIHKEVSNSKQDDTEDPHVESDDDFVPSDGPNNDSDTGSNYSDELQSKDTKSKATPKKQKKSQAKADLAKVRDTQKSKPEIAELNPEFVKQVILEGSLTAEEFACKFCKKDYELNAVVLRKFCLHLGEHEELNEVPKIYKCPICEQCFTRLVPLRKHIKNHDNPAYYECPYPDCHRKFKCKDSVISHEESIHKGMAEIRRQSPKTCPVCGVVVAKGKNSLKAHLLGHPEFELFKCNICSKGFINKYNRNRHQERHKGLKTNICETCGKAFFMIQELETHRITHTYGLDYQCEYCPYRAKRIGTLRNHIKNIHTESDPNKCKCNYCGLTFLDATACRKHEKKHETGVDVKEALLKRFQCTECGYRATKPCYVRIHMRSHTGEKPFKCVHCEKGFTVKRLCNRHMKICKKR